jgi:type I restriction enzyme S subunit
LRFTGFEDNWEEMTLGTCSNSLDYGMNASACEFDGLNKYIRITDIDESSSRYKSESPVSPTGELVDKYLVEENDILFARTGASTGKTYLYNPKDGKLYFAGFLIRAKIKKTYNSYFIFAQTQTVAYNKWVKVMSMRSGQPGINSQEFASYSFYIPTKLEEQNKIASLLLLIDLRIQTQNEIIKRYESLIKSSSQKLFELKLRFKENNRSDYPIWKERQIGKIGMILNGLTGKTKDDFGTGKFYIQYKQIFDSSKIDISKCGKVEISENEKQTIFKFGDVFFTTSSETPNEIGTASVLLNEIDEVYLNSFCFGFRADNNILNPKFSQFLFRSEIFRKKMIPLAQGSTRYNISKSVFVKLKINLPSLEEQIKIANFLNSISVKIETEKNLLEQYKDQKKYFLQNMFI